MKTLQQVHGDLFESYVRREVRHLREQGLAQVDKNWEAPLVPGKAIPREASKPDFSGVVGQRGRHVVFEAKATLSKTSWPLAKLTDHQLEHLELASDLGAIAFVYVLDGARRKWVFPVEHIRGLGRASAPFEGPWEKKKGETWLDTWRRLEVGHV